MDVDILTRRKDWERFKSLPEEVLKVEFDSDGAGGTQIDMSLFGGDPGDVITIQGVVPGDLTVDDFAGTA